MHLTDGILGDFPALFSGQAKSKSLPPGGNAHRSAALLQTMREGAMTTPSHTLPTAAHKHWWQTFETVFGIPFLIAVGLQLVVPLPAFGGYLAPASVPAGLAFIVVGAGLVVLARRELAHHGQPTDPGQPTHRLVTSGVYSVSRNPLYLGGICIIAGIALTMKVAWALILLLPSLIACQYVLISPEEKYLAERFGTDYSVYATAVRRWLGRARSAK